jgi:capsule polysaccharide export protein KpsE/RkpR
VAWTLSWPGVSGAIVGARSPEQVDGWIAAGNLTLDETDLMEITAALERTQAGTGPAQPQVRANDASQAVAARAASVDRSPLSGDERSTR